MLTKGIPKAEGTAAAAEPSIYKRDDGGTPVTARCGAGTNGARSSCFTAARRSPFEE